jgi:hypothetical protein
MNGKHGTWCSAAGMGAPGLRSGPSKSPQSASDLLVRVAGAMPGPACGPAVLHPALVFFDFPRPLKLREPGTCGYGSRPRLESARVERPRMRFFADEEAA